MSLRDRNTWQRRSHTLNCRHSHIQELTHRYAGVTSPSSELQEKRRQVEFLTQESEELRNTITRLRDDLQHAQQDDRELRRRFDVSITELSTEITLIVRHLESELAGNPSDPAILIGSCFLFQPLAHSLALPHSHVTACSLAVDTHPSKFMFMESVRHAVVSLKEKVREAGQQIRFTRDRARSMLQELEKEKEASLAKENERVDTHRELLEVKRSLVDAQVEIRVRGDEVAQLDAQLNDARMQLRQMEAQLQVFVCLVFLLLPLTHQPSLDPLGTR